MTMTRGANGILTHTLCVNDVDSRATWSSYEGSMVHMEAQHLAMPQASCVRNSGAGMAHKSGVASWPLRGAFPFTCRCMRAHLPECGYIPWLIRGS